MSSLCYREWQSHARALLQLPFRCHFLTAFPASQDRARIVFDWRTANHAARADAALAPVPFLLVPSHCARFVSDREEAEGPLLPDQCRAFGTTRPKAAKPTFVVRLPVRSLLVRFLPVNFPLAGPSRLIGLPAPARSAALPLLFAVLCKQLFAAYPILLPVC